MSNNITRKRRQMMSTLYKVTLVLAIIGCVNWGLVGILNFNLVEFLFGDGTILTRVVYVIVALAGLVNIGILTKDLDH